MNIEDELRFEMNPTLDGGKKRKAAKKTKSKTATKSKSKAKPKKRATKK